MVRAVRHSQAKGSVANPTITYAFIVNGQEYFIGRGSLEANKSVTGTVENVSLVLTRNGTDFMCCSVNEIPSQCSGVILSDFNSRSAPSEEEKERFFEFAFDWLEKRTGHNIVLFTDRVGNRHIPKTFVPSAITVNPNTGNKIHSYLITLS